jgi:hypothetical protein
MKAYEVINTPDKWCKGTLALDAGGGHVSPKDLSAVQFCIVGALARVYGLGTENCKMAFRRLRHHLMFNVGGVGVLTFNDSPETTHAQVVDVLKTLDL